MIDRNYIYTLYCAGARTIFEYVEKLDARIEHAQAQTDHSQHAKIVLLSKELAHAKHLAERQYHQLIELRQLNHQLTKRIHELEREITRDSHSSVQLDSHNSSLPPSHDLPWQKIKRTQSLRKKSGRTVGGQLGHSGKTLRQVEYPDQIIIHTPEVCSACRASLLKASVMTTERRQVFEIVHGTSFVTEHQAQTKQCRKCRVSVKAKFPTGVHAPVQYGASVLARVVYLHLYQLIPVARTAEMIRDLFNCHLSVATIQRAARVTSLKLIRCEQRIKDAIREADVIGVDETGLRVAGDNDWIHVARTDELTHYGYDTRRGMQAMNEIGIIPHFTGTLVRDGFPSYQWYQQCQHSLCNAHLLRELIYTEEVDPTQKTWTTPLAKLLIKIKDGVSAAKEVGKVQLDENQKSNWLRCFNQIVKQAAKLNPLPLPSKRQSDAPKKKRSSQPTPHSLIKRLQKHRDAILRFMTDFAIPFDNNGSERDLRMAKLQQKIGRCFRTADGARAFYRVRTYLSPARTQSYSLLQSLGWVTVGNYFIFIFQSPQQQKHCNDRPNQCEALKRSCDPAHSARRGTREINKRPSVHIVSPSVLIVRYSIYFGMADELADWKRASSILTS